jgi:hypothetical protein
VANDPQRGSHIVQGWPSWLARGRRTVLWQHMLQDYLEHVGTVYYNQAPQDYDKGGASLARQ